MSEELIALADDLGFEGLQCTRILQKVEAGLCEFSHLTSATDRLVQLTRILEEKLLSYSLQPVDGFFKRIKATIEAAAARFGKNVSVVIKSRDISLDASQLAAFEAALTGLLEPFIEFTIESQRERNARKKRKSAYIELSARSTEAGHKVSLICDGNGILPPYSLEMGEAIAKTGIRGYFEGSPGKWSSWQFFIPKCHGSVRLLPVKIGENKICIPTWAITSVKDNSLEISAGLSKRNVSINHYSDPYDAYIKNMHPVLKCNGKYLGVVRHEAPVDDDRMYLVLDPGYLVYHAEVENAI